VATVVVIGGFTDVGYFTFLDLTGFAEDPGPQMTYIMATAIAGDSYATSSRFSDLHPA
jgi:hypothetical protein